MGSAQGLAQAHRLRQQALAAAVRRLVARWWGGMDPANPRGSWEAGVDARVRIALTRAQAQAARGVAGYVAAALAVQGVTPDPAGAVVASAFAGVAADGRDLATLLSYPLFQVEAFTRQGMAPDEALAVGGRHLERIVTTEAQDAARVATGVAVVNDRKTTGYIRLLTPPSCSRCVILAGRWYAVNAGFERHPQCDCVHVPAAEVVDPPNPRAVYDDMTAEERTKAGWSAADQQAIADGANLAQVTNAHRDMRSVSVAGQQLQVTLQGRSRRGTAGQRGGARRGKPVLRFTPASVYAEADRLGWSREEIIRALYRFGYLV